MPFNSEPQETEFDLTGLEVVLPELQAACGWTDADVAQAAKASAAAAAAAEKAQQAAEKRGRDEAFRDALAGLADQDMSTRLRAGLTLSKMEITADQREAALPVLTGALSDKSSYVRGYAAETLGNLRSGATRALSTLEALAANDPSPKVRTEAAGAVRRIRGE